MARGVPKGYRHDWTYRGHWKEYKTSPGNWNIDFRATKKTKSGRGGPKPGFRLVWGIKGKQYAVKTSKGTYQTRLIAKKRLIKKGYKRY